MVILIDIGNSNIVFATSDCNQVFDTYRIVSDLSKSSDEYYLSFKGIIDFNNINTVVISSVVPQLTLILKEMLEKYYNIKPLIISKGIKTGINVKTDNPKEVGSDLICACAGAVFNNIHTGLIIDLGTANKLIYMKNKVIMGVVISPGVRISINALVNNTALLPDIDLEVPKKVLGTNTILCMQSGVTYGTVFQIDGFIKRIKEEVNDPNLKIIATGGLANLIIPHCTEKIEVNDKLVLEGILEIFKRN